MSKESGFLHEDEKVVFSKCHSFQSIVSIHVMWGKKTKTTHTQLNVMISEKETLSSLKILIATRVEKWRGYFVRVMLYSVCMDSG